MTERLQAKSSEHADALFSSFAPAAPDRATGAVGFGERLLERYAEAFQSYDVFVEIMGHTAHEMWSGYLADRGQASDETDRLFEVLWANLAQTLRLAREVRHLLGGGFPLGALALQRTAYELALRSIVLEAHGRDPAHINLVNRYVERDYVVNATDAQTYQLNAAALYFDQLDDATVRRLQQRRDTLVRQYGPGYKNAYGWAIGLPGVASGNFRELEELAEVEHRRGFYRWSSHFVHGDSTSLRISVMRRGDTSLGVLSGPTNVMFTDPAQLTLWALQMAYLSLANARSSLGNLFVSRALPHLLDRTADAFLAAEKAIKEADTREDRRNSDPAAQEGQHQQ